MALKPARVWGAWAIVGGLLAVSGGCGERLRPLPPISWEGEALRFGTDVADEPLCGGTLVHLDLTARAIGELFGEDLLPMDFFWLAGPLDAYEPPCRGDVVGCGKGGLARTLMLPGEHEIVHSAKPFVLPQFFEEGLAVYLGSRFPQDPQSQDVLAAIRGGGEPLSAEEYARAGHFMSYLWKRFGPDPLRAMAREPVSYTSVPVEVEAAFLAAFGEPLDEVVAQYQADEPLCGNDTYRRPVAACQDPEPAVVRDGLELHIDLSCEGPHMVRDDTFGELVVEVPLEFPEDWSSWIWLNAGVQQPFAGESIDLVPCDGGCAARIIPFEEVKAPNVNPKEIPAGRYALRIRAPMEVEGVAEFWF